MQLSLPYNEINKHSKNNKKNLYEDKTNIVDLTNGQPLDSNEMNSYKIMPIFY